MHHKNYSKEAATDAVHHTFTLECFPLVLKSWSWPPTLKPSTALLLLLLLLLPLVDGSLRRSIRRAKVCTAALFL